MDKFRRNYTLRTDEFNTPIDEFNISPLGIPGSSITGPQLEVNPPITLEFDISRNILSSANSCVLRVYNLSEDRRKKIYFDPFDTFSYKGIELKAGYEGQTLSTIFKGNVKQAGSVREGVNYVTTIEAYDAGFAFVNGEFSGNFPKGTPPNEILDSIIKKLPAVTKGAVGSFNGSITRGNSFSGNSGELLKEISGGGFFVDLEKAYVLNDSECIDGSLSQITSTSGLLGTPKREGTVLSVDILLEPRLLIGQQIELVSMTEKNYNGTYKVISVHHRGVISGAVCGDAVTTVGLWVGTQQLSVVKSG